MFTLHISSLAGSISFCYKSVDNPPKLLILRHFPVKDRYFDIAEKIGTNYEHFGTLLLNDIDGSKINKIEKLKHGDPVGITAEILEQWLQGKGRLPVTWQTLIKCLRDTKMTVLADYIESSSLSKHSHSQEL